MQDKLYDVRYDTGDKVIQCGRHNDIFKLWLQWRAKVQCEASAASSDRVQIICNLVHEIVTRDTFSYVFVIRFNNNEIQLISFVSPDV